MFVNVYIWGIPGRFTPGCDPHYFFFFFFFFSFKYVMDDHKKRDLHLFSDFFENLSGSNGRNHRGMRAVIDSC